MKNDISCLIAFVCNPYLAVMQKQTYLKYWKDEIDELLINVNGRNDQIRKFIVDLWKDDDKVKVVNDLPAEMRQGTAFDSLCPAVEGKVLMTLDSDNFIYKKGVVEAHSNMILSGQYDAVGSAGHHARPVKVADKLVSKYTTVRLNPFMSFWNMGIVMRIPNLTFGTHSIEKGERWRFYGDVDERISLDVMSYFSLQFFELSKKICKIPSAREGEYVHVGALSSIFRRNFRSIENFDNTEYKVAEIKQHSLYYCWYWLIYEATKNQVIPEYNKRYEENFNGEISKIGLTMDDIKAGSEKIKMANPGLF